MCYISRTKGISNEEGNSYRRTECSYIAKRWLDDNPLFLDTETTGKKDKDEVVEISIVDVDGRVLLNTLIKPSVPIKKKATEKHGITDNDVVDAPRWEDVHTKFCNMIKGRTIIIFNEEFDKQKINQTARKHGPGKVPWDSTKTRCAMQLFSEWYGDYKEYYDDYTWKSLEVALEQFNLIDKQTHRAKDDAQLVRKIVKKMKDYNFFPDYLREFTLWDIILFPLILPLELISLFILISGYLDPKYGTWNLITIFLLLGCFPVGILLMWPLSSWTKQTKFIITGILGGLILISGAVS